jgi:hypothetical protein
MRGAPTFEALDAGWHVSAQYNQDNHSANWGDRNDNRSGVWMRDLSRASLFEGMRAMRTFATTDKNATIRMMADDTCWMGSTIRGTGHVTLSVEVTDADASDGFDNIEIYMKGKKLVSHLDCGGATKCTKSYVADTKSAAYFVARATQKDGNWLVSAPIWVEP